MRYGKHLHIPQLLHQRIPHLISLPRTSEAFPLLQQVMPNVESFLDHLWHTGMIASRRGSANYVVKWWAKVVNWSGKEVFCFPATSVHFHLFVWLFGFLSSTTETKENQSRTNANDRFLWSGKRGTGKTEIKQKVIHKKSQIALNSWLLFWG